MCHMNSQPDPKLRNRALKLPYNFETVILLSKVYNLALFCQASTKSYDSDGNITGNFGAFLIYLSLV